MVEMEMDINFLLIFLIFHQNKHLLTRPQLI